MQNNVSLEATELESLRYGENPHQKSKLYQVNQPKLATFDYIQLSGKALSFNN